jgi:hypothetical protein
MATTDQAQFEMDLMAAYHAIRDKDLPAHLAQIEYDKLEAIWLITHDELPKWW